MVDGTRCGKRPGESPMDVTRTSIHHPLYTIHDFPPVFHSMRFPIDFLHHVSVFCNFKKTGGHDKKNSWRNLETIGVSRMETTSQKIRTLFIRPRGQLL